MGRKPHKTESIRVDVGFKRFLESLKPQFENVSLGAIAERLCKEALAARAIKAFVEAKTAEKK